MALPANATFTWYGHSCWELRTGSGTTVLFDPWFSNPTSPKRADSVDRCDLLQERELVVLSAACLQSEAATRR